MPPDSVRGANGGQHLVEQGWMSRSSAITSSTRWSRSGTQGLRKIVGAAQLAEQAGVLHRDHRLSGEALNSAICL